MLKRGLKLTLEFIAVLVAGFAVLLVLAAVRLSYGPVPLDFITPYVARGLSADDGSIKVAIDRTVLTWAGWARTVDIQLSGVRVTGADGREKAFVPDLAISFSIRALLDGRIAPTRLELFGPRLRVVRQADGALTLGETQVPITAQPSAEEARLGSDLTADVLAHLAAPPDHKGPLGYLRSISLLNADFIFEDLREGVTIRAPGSDILLARDHDGVGGNAHLNILADGRRARIDLAGGYNPQRKALELDVHLAGMEPAVLAPLSPDLKALEGARVPISGTVQVRTNLQGVVGDVSLDLTAGAGTIAVPSQFDAPVTLRSARLKARATDGLNNLVLEAFTADFDGPRIALSGSGTRKDGAVKLALDLGARDVNTADLRRLWPKGAASGGRDWVLENVEKGGVSKLTAHADITAREDGKGGISDVVLDKLDGGFDFSGVSIHFLRPLPPVTDVAGHATLSPSAITFQAKSGRLGALHVREGSFRAYALDTETQLMDIETVVEGPIADVVTLLNHPRLDLIKGLGIKPASVKGVAATRLKLKFPLAKNLKFDDMDLAAAANLRGVALPGVALGNDLTDGNLTLQLDKHGMDVNGDVKLGGVPARLGWTENFQSHALFRSRYHVQGTADDAARAKFGLDFLKEYAQGPVGADIIVTRYDDKKMSLSASLDLKNAALSFAELGWRKLPGVTGFARLTLPIEDDKVKAVDNLVIRAGDMSAAGAIGLGPDGKSIRSFNFGELRYGDNDMRVRGRFRDDGGLALDVTGNKADVRFFLAQKDDGKPKRPLDISVDLGTVRAAPNAVIAGVKGRLVRDKNDWQDVDVKGTVGKGKSLAMSIKRVNGTRKLLITSDDAGDALKAFDVTDNMVSGKLHIDGSYDDGKPGRPLTAHMAVDDFQMVKTPFLAKLLSVASLTGILDALTGQGISFNRADVPFVKTGDDLVLKQARAHGAAIGFTADGRIDLDKDTMDLTGTVVPAYSLNSVFADIPILGALLVPEKGSGLFAATYSMKGPIENPDVSVNPLATLTPGFLRGLFNIFDAKEKPKEAPKPPAPAAPQPQTTPQTTPQPETPKQPQPAAPATPKP